MAPRKRKPSAAEWDARQKRKKQQQQQKRRLTASEAFQIREYERQLRHRGDTATLQSFRAASQAQQVNRARQSARRLARNLPDLPDASDINESPERREALTRRFDVLQRSEINFRRFVGSGIPPADERIHLADWWDNDRRVTQQNYAIVRRRMEEARDIIVETPRSELRVRYNFAEDPEAVRTLFQRLDAEFTRNPDQRFLLESEDSSTYYPLTSDNYRPVINELTEEGLEERNPHESDPNIVNLVTSGTFYISRPRPRGSIQRIRRDMEAAAARQTRRSRVNRGRGSAFDHLHTFPDTEEFMCQLLERYDIYNKIDSANYRENCAIKAIRNSGKVSLMVLEQLRQSIVRRSISRTALGKVGKDNGIKFVIHTAGTSGDKSDQTRTTSYGDLRSSVVVELALYRNHYFIFEKTPVNGFAIQNYPDHPKLQQATCWGSPALKDKWYSITAQGDRRPNRGISSLHLVRSLVEKTNLMTIIDRGSTDAYSTELIDVVGTNYATLEYPETCSQPVHPPRFHEINWEDERWETIDKLKTRMAMANPRRAPKIIEYLERLHEKHGMGPEEQLSNYKRHMPSTVQVFFDTETTTDGGHFPVVDPNYDSTKTYPKEHYPYMVAWSVCDDIQDDEKPNVKCLIGRGCIDEFLNALVDQYGNSNEYPPTIELLAHNLTYDIGWLMTRLSRLRFTEKGTSVVMGTGTYRQGIRSVNIKFKDTWKMYPMKLKDYAESQHLSMGKELLPYHCMTSYLIDQMCGLVNYDQIINDCGYEGSDLEQFKENIEKWECTDPDDDQVDMLRYAKEYCIIDVAILHTAWTRSRKSCLEQLDMDQDAYPTQAGLSHQRMINQGVYDGVRQLSGVPQDFIRRANIGGRVMCGFNRKIDTTEADYREPGQADIDARSLYPSSMHFGPGYPLGSPKVIPKGQQDLSMYDYYFVEVRFTKVGKPRKFPVTCVTEKNDKGQEVNNWTSDLVGKTRVIGKITAEDLKEFMDVEYEVIQGYYFDEGFNTSIHGVIGGLYNQRLRLKAEKNPGQLVVKLHMNSAYGKTGLKIIKSDIEYIAKTKIVPYINNHSNDIKRLTVMPNGTYRVERYKCVIDQYNIIPVSCIVLEMSKRLMNRVMYCLEKDEDEKFIDYTDTDSIQMAAEYVPTLERVYKERYGRELMGKQMGEFGNDLEFEGSITRKRLCDGTVKVIETDFKAEGEITSDMAIYCGKKAYVLRTLDEAGNVAYQVRLKGIPSACIMDKLNSDEYKGDIVGLYKDLYAGKPVEFILGSGTSVNFKVHHNHTITTVKQPRTVQFI